MSCPVSSGIRNEGRMRDLNGCCNGDRGDCLCFFRSAGNSRLPRLSAVVEQFGRNGGWNLVSDDSRFPASL